MKQKLKRYKEIFRVISFIPSAALVQVYPINIVLLGIQLFCFAIMFYVGWNYEN